MKEVTFLSSMVYLVLSLTVNRKHVAPGENISVKLTATASRSGDREIIVNFVADQLGGMSGIANIYVTYAE